PGQQGGQVDFAGRDGALALEAGRLKGQRHQQGAEESEGEGEAGRPLHGASSGALQARATWIFSLMCLRLATMVKVMITSSDHELHLLTWTTDQAPSWFG